MANELRVVGWYAIDHDGYEAINLKENHVLRAFDAEAVTANALVMLADADALLNAKCAEIERLKVQLASFKDGAKADIACMVSQHDEIEAQRLDADRYRWLRDEAENCDFHVPMVHITDRRGRVDIDDEGFATFESGSDLDDSVDEAMRRSADEATRPK